jgi:hypothetical protein
MNIFIIIFLISISTLGFQNYYQKIIHVSTSKTVETFVYCLVSQKAFTFCTRL